MINNQIIIEFLTQILSIIVYVRIMKINRRKNTEKLPNPK